MNIYFVSNMCLGNKRCDIKLLEKHFNVMIGDKNEC
jgi:hypothetical protein